MASVERGKDTGQSGGGGFFYEPFYRTSLEYWKASTQNYSWYWILTVFFGWAGLDMLYLRSPLMAVAKIFLNAITFGYWWFYDAMEATFNKDQVQVAGPTMPFWGSLGIAGGMFMGTGSQSKQDKHYTFLLYSLVLLFTGLFGGDSFLVGDKLSGYIRVISLVSFFFAPIAIIWYIYKLYQLFIRPDQLLDQNYIYFGAPEPANLDLLCPNVLESASVWIVHTSAVVLSYIPILGNFAPLLLELDKRLRQAYGMTKSVVEEGQKIVDTLPDVITNTASVAELNPREVKETKEKEEKGAMKGGGAQENLTAFGSIALVASLAFVMISSLSMTLWRTYKNWKNGVEAEDDQRKDQKYDDPPNPRVSGRSFAE